MQRDMLEERRRSMSIQLYGLDVAPDCLGLEELDEIAGLLRDALAADGAGINLLVGDLQVTVGSSDGVIAPVGRESSVCSTVLQHHHTGELVETPDLREVPELADNPFVDGSVAALRFYAAAPLTGKHGLALGTLCAWSTQPRTLDARERSTLRQLGRSVVNVLDEHRRPLVPDRAGVLRRAR